MKRMIPILLIVAGLLAGCKKSESENQFWPLALLGSSGEATMAFDYTLAALHGPTLGESPLTIAWEYCLDDSRSIRRTDFVDRAPDRRCLFAQDSFHRQGGMPRRTRAALAAGKSRRAVEVLTGELVAGRIGGSSETFFWSVTLDESAMSVTSNKTIILDPGDYNFSLVLTQGDRQYMGEANGVAIIDGENTIDLTVRPVIGDTVTQVNLENVAALQFQYDPAQLGALANPRIGVSVDGGAEQILVLNPTTGISDGFVNLTPGEHTIQLKLYDTGMLMGKSIPEQEAVTIVLGQNITMDLVPLHGETVFNLEYDGGPATFQFVIPAEAVDAAGGPDSLETLFQVTGAANGLHEKILSLTQNGTNYESSVTFDPFHYDTVTIALTFSDKSQSPAKELGSCTVDGVALSTNGQAVQCDAELVFEASGGGNLLAVLGLNVFDTGNAPVAGAKIYANGEFLGLTGSGSFGTPGYLKAFLPAGDYGVTAVGGSNAGSETTTLAPLGIGNLDVFLDQPLAASCKAHLDAGNSFGDGVYPIDPDGAGSGAPFEVYCDMTTDGGGWTRITLDLAYNLNSVMVAVDSTGIAGMDGQFRPYTQDEGDDHTYHYTFDVPFGYTQFFLSGYSAKANSPTGYTSDINLLEFHQTNWDHANYGPGTGDISFGTSTMEGPTASFAKELPDFTSCTDCVIPWPADAKKYTLQAKADTFRIGWGESGPEYEGWYPWWEGYIYVR